MAGNYKSEKSIWERSYQESTTNYADPYNMSGNTSDSFDLVLSNINKIKTEAVSKSLTDYYFTQGSYGVHKKLSVSEYSAANTKARKLCTLAKRFHKETVQNIDSKFTIAMSNTLNDLNNVNEGDKKYTTKNLAKEEEQVTYDEYGNAYKYNIKKKYTLEQILNSKDSPIKAAREVYQKNLKALKQQIKEMSEGQQKDLKDFSDEKLMQTFFTTELGSFEKIKSSFHEKYGGILTAVDVVGTIALAVLTVVSGPIGWVAGGALITASAGKLIYGLSQDESLIDGKSLNSTGKVLLGAELLASILTLGNSTLLNKIIGKVGNSLTTGQKVANWALTKGISDIIGMVTNPLGKLAEKVLGKISEKTLQKILSNAIKKVNFKEAIANQDGLGQGFKEVSKLRADDIARLNKLNRITQANLTDEELLALSQVMDFAMPDTKGGRPGIGFEFWDESLLNESNINTISKITLGIEKYNKSQGKDYSKWNETQVSMIDKLVSKLVGKSTGSISKEIKDSDLTKNYLENVGISKDLVNQIMDKLNLNY